MTAIFHGTIKITGDDSEKTEVEFQATCDANGLGLTLGVVARAHLQGIPAEHRAREFHALLASFVTSAAQSEPVEVLEGEMALVPIGACSKVPS